MTWQRVDSVQLPLHPTAGPLAFECRVAPAAATAVAPPPPPSAAAATARRPSLTSRRFFSRPPFSAGHQSPAPAAAEALRGDVGVSADQLPLAAASAAAAPLLPLPLPAAATSAACYRGAGHLIVCVHGMSGNMHDLRLLRLTLQGRFPDLVFLMSAANQTNTHAGLAVLAGRLMDEVNQAMARHRPRFVSFVGHSLGAVVVRAALADAGFRAGFRAGAGAGVVPGLGDLFRPRLWLFLSLCGPHLGAQDLGHTVAAGMWFMTRFLRSASLVELSLEDARDPRDGTLYKLSDQPGARRGD